jgi:hypothetical protein
MLFLINKKKIGSKKKKKTLLFLFTFFSLILDAPRTYLVPMTHFLRRICKTVPRAESKEKHGVWDPMPELILTSLYVHSRVDSKTLTMGNPMPESTLTPICQSRLFSPVSLSCSNYFLWYGDYCLHQVFH